MTILWYYVQLLNNYTDNQDYWKLYVKITLINNLKTQGLANAFSTIIYIEKSHEGCNMNTMLATKNSLSISIS